jgi:hypothetical protein
MRRAEPHFSLPRNRLVVESGLWVAYIAITSAVGALSAITERARLGNAIAAWEPFVWEYSSGLAILILIPAVAAFERRAPLWSPKWLRATLLHLAATLPFSATHVALMVGLRKIAYVCVGRVYDFGNVATEFLYEWRKDALTYFFIIAVLYSYRWLQTARLGEAALPDAPSNSIEVRWNGRRFKVRAEEIEWIEAAGNYVIVHTATGEHMLRGTLKAFLEQLPQRNFVRVHRSAAVNLDMVAELDARHRSAKLRSGGVAPIAQTYWSDLAVRFSARNEASLQP